jgi:hypothetical protein
MSFESTAHESMISENLELVLNCEQKDSIDRYEIPQRLKKTFYLSILLFVAGIVLLIVAIVEFIQNDSIWNGLQFLILSAIVMIPGSFYTIQFIRAWMAKEIDIKMEIFDNIPEVG